MSKFKEIWADSQSTEGGHMSKAEELADAICRIDTLTEYQRELIAQAAAELRRLDALEQAAEPVAWLYVGGYYGEELQEWEIEAEQVFCDKLNEKHIGHQNKLPLYTHPARKPMTRDDMRKLLKEHFDNGDLTGDDFRLIRAVERFHQIEGQP
jgi:hypothetical protein